MAKLTDFSNELLLDVVSHLTTSNASDVKALLHLCRTSRALCNVALPALYTSVRIAESQPDPLNRMKLFLRTIIECPSLARETEELALTNDRGVRYEWPGLQHDAAFMELSALIGRNQGEIEPELCYCPLAAFVLARLPKLQHLHFTAQIEQPRALLRHMHEMEADSGCLGSLKSFFFHKQYEDGPVDISDYIPLIRYPSFAEFSTRSDISDTPCGSSATNTLTPSSAELLWCMGPSSKMHQLLNACSLLTRFKLIIPDWRRYRHMSDVAHHPLVTPRALTIALLETHRKTLETLYLDFHHYYDLSDPELREEIEDAGYRFDESYCTYPSFRAFERLAHLTIEFEKLVHVRHLPDSLRSLNLQSCRFGDLDGGVLRNLVRLKETWCPALESVTLGGWEETNESVAAVRECLRALGVLVRVSLDGRVLMLLGVGFEVRISSRESVLSDASACGEEEEMLAV
ncbi:hypothetical protein M3J09_013635 [Ascochyta lentis]